MGYNSLLRKIVLIIGDIICLYLATSIAMALELGNKQTDKIAFHLEFLPILVIMMFFMFNVYGLFSLIRKKLVDIFLNLLVAVTNIYNPTCQHLIYNNKKPDSIPIEPGKKITPLNFR